MTITIKGMTEMISSRDPLAVLKAATAIRHGQPVAFPTDTVYGLGVHAFDAIAIRKLYEIKGRPEEKGIPVLLADVKDINLVAESVSPVAKSLMERFWPGPLTIIVPKNRDLPDDISPNGTIAVRIPNHSVVRHMIRAAGGAVATTSANLSGQPAALSGDEVFAVLNGLVPIILDDGPSSGNQASTIVNCMVEPPVILREGPLSAAELGL